MLELPEELPLHFLVELVEDVDHGTQQIWIAQDFLPLYKLLFHHLRVQQKFSKVVKWVRVVFQDFEVLDHFVCYVVKPACLMFFLFYKKGDNFIIEVPQLLRRVVSAKVIRVDYVREDVLKIACDPFEESLMQRTGAHMLLLERL